MQTILKNLFSIATLTLISLSFFSCKKGDSDDMLEAQYCLNKAANSEARACVSKIESKGTPSAYKLMCASVFISKGFGSVSSFASAIDQITHPSGGGCTGNDCAGSLNAMNVMNFGTDATAASQAVDFCTKSQVVAYSQMSSMFSIGTQMKIALGNTSNPSATDLENAVQAIPDSTLGSIVNQTYSSSCSDLTNASNETKQYCAQLQVAVSNTDGSNAAVGAFLKNCLQNPGVGVCPK